MHRGVSNLRNILPRIQTSRFSVPERAWNAASRDFSLIQYPRRPVLSPGPLSSHGSDETDPNVLAPSRTIWGLATLSPRICFTQPSQQTSCSLPAPRRNKSTKAKGGKRRGHTREKIKQEFSDEDDSDDDDFELESGLDFRDMRVRVPSARMDAVLKAGLKMPRSKVETAFYASKIRVNGEKTLKKSKQVHEGDEFDVIKGVSNVNHNMLNISRIVILRVGKYNEDSDMYEITLRKYPQLLVPKYNDFESEVDDSKAPH